MNWVCECGIVNAYEEKECGQCGQLRADAWVESDRETVFAVRVLDVSARSDGNEPRGLFYDRCYQLPPDCEFVNPMLRHLCHQPFVQTGKDDPCR